MQTLVSVKLHLGKNAEAKTLAQELVGELRKLDSEESDSRFPQRLAKGLACLAESYAANGNMNDAEKVCEELAALAFDDLLADSTMLGVRGAIEFDRENWNSAEELFIKSFERLDAERDDLENESLWVLQRASDRVLEFYQTDGIQIPFKPRKISIWKKRQSKTTKQIAEMLNPLGEMK